MEEPLSAAQIVCLGLSHRTAPVEIRERLSCSATDLKRLLQSFREGNSLPINELVILSTCNRMEIYAVIAAKTADPRHFLTQYLSEIRGIPAHEIADHLYFYAGKTAVNHLCRVAAGLESLVLGEPQILGQVTDAYTAAVAAHTAGAVLSRVFETAMRSGKRGRTETAISSNPASISSVAIALAQRVVGDLSNQNVLIIGVGAMAELALKALQARGVQHVAIANRSCTRAEAIAAEWGGEAYGLDRLGEALQAADVVISATGAPHLILDANMVGATMERRNGRELVLIDIAVPRDIDPQAKYLPGVHLFDVDGLQDNLDKALAARRAEIPQVETIIVREMETLAAQLRQLTVTPFISDLRQKAETIRRRELERTLRHLGDLDEQTLDSIQHLSRSLVNKLLHEPTIRIKEQACNGNGRSPEYVAAARYLFGLEEARN